MMKKLFSCLQRGYAATQAMLPNVTNVTTIDRKKYFTMIERSILRKCSQMTERKWAQKMDTKISSRSKIDDDGSITV